jgi:hypothetical protein
MYEPAVCCGWSGERESLESRGGSLAAYTLIGAGGEWSRRKKPMKGVFGLPSPLRSGEREYIEDPLIMERTLVCSALKREEFCDAGDPSDVWSGRGDHLNNVGIGIVGVLVLSFGAPEFRPTSLYIDT